MYDDELQNFDELQYFHELQNFLQSNFGEKEPRKCPECTKCKDDSIPKYFVSLGSLKEHLLEHYRVKYYLEHYDNKTEARYTPWHDDYAEVDTAQLAKYMDKELFGDYLERLAKEKEAKRQEKRRREEKQRRGEKGNRNRECYQHEFDKKFKSDRDQGTDSKSSGTEQIKLNNSRKFPESPDSDGGKKKRKRETSLDDKKAKEEPKKRKPVKDVIEQLDLTKLDLNLENLSEEGDLGHVVAGNITALDIRQNGYRFCPICSKDRIPLDNLRDHVKNCMSNASKIYNSLIVLRG